MTKFNIFRVCAVLVVLMASTIAFSQALPSTVHDVTLNAELAEQLTVDLNGTTNVNFTLAPNTAVNAGDTQIVTTTTWVLDGSRGHVVLSAYFGSADALVNSDFGTYTIPTTSVSASIDSGAPATFAGSGSYNVTVFDQAITDVNRNSTRNATVDLSISTTFDAQLPAGTYTGTLHFQAQATT